MMVEKEVCAMRLSTLSQLAKSDMNLFDDGLKV